MQQEGRDTTKTGMSKMAEERLRRRRSAAEQRVKAAAKRLDRLCGQGTRPSEFHLSHKISKLNAAWAVFRQTHEVLFGMVSEEKVSVEMMFYKKCGDFFDNALNRGECMKDFYRVPAPTLEQQFGSLLQQRAGAIKGVEGTLERIFSVLENAETVPDKVSLLLQLEVLNEVKQVMKEAEDMTTELVKLKPRMAAEIREGGHRKELVILERIQGARNLAAALADCSGSDFLPKVQRDEHFPAAADLVQHQVGGPQPPTSDFGAGMSLNEETIEGSDLILDDAKFVTQPNEIEDPISRERQKFIHQECEERMHFGDRATACELEVSKHMVAHLRKAGDPEAVEKTRKSYVNAIIAEDDEVTVDRLVGAGGPGTETWREGRPSYGGTVPLDVSMKSSRVKLMARDKEMPPRSARTSSSPTEKILQARSERVLSCALSQ